MAQMARQLLIDTTPIQLQLVEAGEGGKLLVRGEFARTDRPTENKRLYTRGLMERELKRLVKPLKERQVLGELDHPADGRTQLTRVSHLITGLHFDGDVLVGEAEPLDTDRGKNLKALLQSGAKIGVSSRGYGSTKSNEKGEEVVQDDYRLVTFDFVAEPADSTAYPEVVYEETEMDLKDVTVESLRAANPALVEQLTQEREKELAAEWAKKLEAAKAEAEAQSQASLKEAFTHDMTEAVGKLKNELREQVRGEFLADPAVAASRQVVEQVKSLLRPFILPEDAESVVKQKDAEIAKIRQTVVERDLRVQQLEADLTELESVAREVGYKLYLEQKLAGDPDAALLRKMVGDVKAYPKAEAIGAKLDSIREELTKRRETEAAEQQRRDREVAAVKAEEQKLQSKVDKLTEALEKSLSVNKELGLRVYTESLLANHPQAVKVRGLMESVNPQSKEDVDRVLAQYREPVRTQESLDEVRARVRHTVGSGSVETTALNEEAPPTRSRVGTENWNGLGVSLQKMQELAGIEPRK
jgi:hypothetical protein